MVLQAQNPMRRDVDAEVAAAAGLGDAECPALPRSTRVVRRAGALAALVDASGGGAAGG
jgi:hypothetical protein